MTTPLPAAPARIVVAPHVVPSAAVGAAPVRKSVVHVPRAWYVACRSSALGAQRLLARTILGVPLALWRGGAVGARGQRAPSAVLDRCPHRNVPLSLGQVKVSGELVCRYHGWHFDGGGKLTQIPGLPIVEGTDGHLDAPGRRASVYPCVEQDGYVWVWLDPASPPTEPPHALTQLARPGYLTVRREFTLRATLHATLENILDVPHTSFLHGGLFRTAEKSHAITAVVRRARTHVEAEFIGEPRPTGLAARILSPSGGLITHFDRFFLPSVAQVEYRIGAENHIVTTTMCTPVDDTTTVMHAVLSVKTRIPAWLLAPFAAPVALRIVGQDKWILEKQTELVDRLGSESFSSTPIDLLGPHILHLLKKAEANALDDAVVREEQTTLMV